VGVDGFFFFFRLPVAPASSGAGVTPICGSSLDIVMP
jgi:hypothetical protein